MDEEIEEVYEFDLDKEDQILGNNVKNPYFKIYEGIPRLDALAKCGATAVLNNYNYPE